MLTGSRGNRLFETPELVAIVLDYCLEGGKRHDVNYLLVNNLFFNETARLMWANSAITTLGKVENFWRRQMYASFVVRLQAFVPEARHGVLPEVYETDPNYVAMTKCINLRFKRLQEVEIVGAFVHSRFDMALGAIRTYFSVEYMPFVTPQLKRMDISTSGITPRDLEQILSRCQDLEAFSLCCIAKGVDPEYGNVISHHISRLPLKSLWIKNRLSSDVQQKMVQAAATKDTLTNIEGLDEWVMYKNAIEQDNRSFKTLQRLTCTCVDTKHLGALSNLQNLTTLSLTLADPNASNICTKLVAHTTQLRYLRLTIRNVHVEHNDLLELQKFSQLEEVKLNSGGTTDNDFTRDDVIGDLVKCWPRLRSFELTDSLSRFSHKVLVHLSGCANLTSLYLWGHEPIDVAPLTDEPTLFPSVTYFDVEISNTNDNYCLGHFYNQHTPNFSLGYKCSCTSPCCLSPVHCT